MVNKWLNVLHRRLFPPTCILCGAPGSGELDICPVCKRELPFLTHQCGLCAVPLPEQGICGHCQQAPPLFDRCYAPFRYEGAIAELITGLKFRARLQDSRLLAGLMTEWIDANVIALPQRLIPVPLHPSRLRERGYNQSLELAHPLARHLRIPLSHQSCVRLRATGAQSSLPRKERARNVKGAFELRGLIGARHIALLDDVVTTGSTVNELARLFKGAGVERVDVWCVARTG